VRLSVLVALLQRSYRVLGEETGWRRLKRRIHASKSEVQYCAFEFRTSSNLRQNFYGAVAQNSCDSWTRKTDELSVVWSFCTNRSIFYDRIQYQCDGLNFKMAGEYV
jgi:hypothetical protein